MAEPQLFLRLVSATTGTRFAPAELRERIVAEVEAEGSNLKAVVVGRLCARYGVPYEGGDRRAHPSGRDDVINVRIPEALAQALDRAGFESGLSRQDEALAALCDDYGLPFEPARKRNGPKRLPAAA